MEAAAAASPHAPTAASRTIADLISNSAAVHAEHVAIRYKQDGEWKDVTYAQLAEIVQEIGLGLIDLGLQPGERICILANTRPEWSYADMAATSAGGFPIGPWLPDNLASAWIAPTASTDGPGNAFYGYQTTFDLNGLDPTDATIQGWVASDDGLAGILINANSVAFPSDAGFTYWRAFSVGGGAIQPGVNTLTFIVYNAGLANNPTGLRVQMCGWAWTTRRCDRSIRA